MLISWWSLMTTKGQEALNRAINEEVERDHLFLEKCDYHDELMEDLFYSKGFDFTNCHESNGAYKSEVQDIFDKIGQLMKEKFK